MKVTQSQLVEFLKTLGVGDVEVVENDTDADFSADDVLTAIDTNREPIIKSRLHDSIYQDAAKTISGKAGGTLRKYLRELTGIDRKAIDSIENDADAIKAAIDFKVGTLTQSQEDVQAKIKELQEAHDSELQAKKGEWEKQYNDLNTKYTERDLRGHFRTLADAYPLPAKGDKSELSGDFYQYMANKYALKYDAEGKKLEIFDKANPNMPAMANNRLLDINEEAKNYFSKRAAWETDMRNAELPKTPGTPYTPAAPGAAQTIPGMQEYNPKSIVDSINAAASAAGVQAPAAAK